MAACRSHVGRPGSGVGARTPQGGMASAGWTALWGAGPRPDGCYRHFGDLPSSRPRTGERLVTRSGAGGRAARPPAGIQTLEQGPPPPPELVGDQGIAGFHAGAMFGGKPLQRNGMGLTTVKIPDTTKFLTFVVDMQHAKLLDDEPKRLTGMIDDLQDALGVTTEVNPMQAIFSFYDGQERQEVNDDVALNKAYGGFELHQSLKVKASKQAHQPQQDRRNSADVKKLTRLRLGGAVTKVQMQIHLRNLNATRARQNDLRTAQEKWKKETQALEESIPPRIEKAQMEARATLTEELARRAKVEMMEVKAKLEADYDAKLAELQRKILDRSVRIKQMKERIEALESEKEQLEKAITKVEKEKQEEKVELAKVRHGARASADAMKEHEAQRLEWASRGEVCMALLQENGIELCFGEDGTMSVIKTEVEVGEEEEEEEDAVVLDYFDWTIPQADAKIEKYPTDRGIQSPEFQCGTMEEMQAEFFPNGLKENSYPGWCALRLRVPNRTLLEWQVHVGGQEAPVAPLRLGPRRDIFDEEAWWCRQGITWPNLCRIEELQARLEEAEDENARGSLTLRIERLWHVELPVGEEPENATVAEGKAPFERPPTVSTRASTALSSSFGRSAGALLPRLPSAGTGLPKEPEGMRGMTKYKTLLLKIQYKGEFVFDRNLSQMVCDYLWRSQARRLFLHGELTSICDSGSPAVSLDPAEETRRLQSSWGGGWGGGASVSGNPLQGSPPRRTGNFLSNDYGAGGATG